MKCKLPDCERAAESRGMCNMHYERWRKRGDPTILLQRPHHTGSPTGTGYWHTKIDGTRKQDHVWVAERALGKPLPKGAVVHHVDENPLNNSPSNLVVCPSIKYHALLHKRMRAFAACGNYSFERCWICKTYSDPAEMRELRRENGTGYFYHATCQSERAKINHAKRKEARRAIHVP